MQCYPHAGPVFLTNLPTPFSKSVTLLFGRLFTIKGSIPLNPHRFSFNFMIGPDGDNVFHLDNRFDQGCVVRNTRRSGQWLREERDGNLLLRAGQNFELMVLVEESRFMIAYNGCHFTEFVHRMPVASITSVYIAGDVKITTYQESMAFPNWVLPGAPLPIAHRAGTQQCYEIKNCMSPGGKLHVGGVPTGGTFVIDLRPDVNSEEIGLHMSCRLFEGVVVLNSRMGKAWQQEIRPRNLIFRKGHYFDLRISSSHDELLINLNGVAATNFPVRHIHPAALRGLIIHGDVTVGFVTS